MKKTTQYCKHLATNKFILIDPGSVHIDSTAMANKHSRTIIISLKNKTVILSPDFTDFRILPIFADKI